LEVENMAGKPITSVEDAFKSFERNTARVPDGENTDGKTVHPEIRKAVTDAFANTEHFLSGSYGRRTQAMKLKDVDIIVVLQDPDGRFKASASATLEAVREVVSDHELVRTTRISVRAVKAFLHDYEFHVDIVPALASPLGSGLQLTRNIPEDGLDDWTLEDPRGQLGAAQEKNKATDGIYVPATRIIKAWNQRYETAKPLRSYHAEAILWHAVSKKSSFEDAVLAFFDKAYDVLAPGARMLVPGSQTRYVDERLADDDRAKAREKVDAAREKAHDAADKDDPGEGMDAWVKVFGTAFPAPSTDTDALAAGLREGTAKAVGAGFAVGGLGEREPIAARSWSHS
jgi:hypothetical protein